MTQKYDPLEGCLSSLLGVAVYGLATIILSGEAYIFIKSEIVETKEKQDLTQIAKEAKTSIRRLQAESRIPLPLTEGREFEYQGRTYTTRIDSQGKPYFESSPLEQKSLNPERETQR